MRKETFTKSQLLLGIQGAAKDNDVKDIVHYTNRLIALIQSTAATIILHDAPVYEAPVRDK